MLQQIASTLAKLSSSLLVHFQVPTKFNLPDKYCMCHYRYLANLIGLGQFKFCVLILSKVTKCQKGSEYRLTVSLANV